MNWLVKVSNIIWKIFISFTKLPKLDPSENGQLGGFLGDCGLTESFVLSLKWFLLD